MKAASSITCALVFLVLAGCGARPRPVVIGSKATTEQQVLGEIIAQHLERTLKQAVARRLSLGDTLPAHQALITGEIDLYPEYTGAASSEVLRLPIATDSTIVRERAQREYAAMQIVWLPPLGFNSAFVAVVRAEEARQAKLETVSDAVRAAEPWVLAARPDFVRATDGFAILARAYGLPVKGAVRMMDSATAYAALAHKQVSMVAGRATDGALGAEGTAMLRDDLNAFPPYEAAIVVRQAALNEHPGLQAALERLSGRISAETMRKLNAEVEFKHRPVPVAAAEFLHSIQ